MITVKSAVESLADRYLKWWRPTSDGRNINGACPFHHESTEGAFYMSTETGLWICHGCQARGNLLSFLKEVGAAARVVARDVLVGDVWLLGGQSNMQGKGSVFTFTLPAAG